MSFTDELWRETEPVLEAIHQHPFVIGLGDGSLPRATFEHYMVQDALYLGDYARAMGLLASRAERADEITFWGLGVHGAAQAERELHARHVAVGAGVQAPTTRAYTSYLLATAATAPYQVGVAAILPCFWIYQVVGDSLLVRGGDLTGHPYADWIQLYADPAFAAQAARARDITDRCAADAGESCRVRMREAYVVASRYEWMFWDAAWRMEDWPV